MGFDDLHDTAVMLYQQLVTHSYFIAQLLSYEVLLESGQERVQFIPVIWRESHGVYMI